MRSSILVAFLILSAAAAFGQTEGARISGRVTDLTGAVIVGAECKITNIETEVSVTTTTNEDGIYVLPDLHPANYRLTIEKKGFRTVIQPNLQLYVQDAFNENFTLAIGPMSDSVTVSGSTFGVRTDSAAVSTVVDDQFVQNMPMNGRSFQTLIALAPGVVFVSANEGAGQFSVNGQRTDANYFTVDGVSANFGVASGCCLGQTIGGAIPGFTAGGGTNGLVSVDDMQEFRIQTSSNAPEYGRVPGAQISIVTKSGGNQFHGTAFDYVRNDVFDARNYFDAPPLPKPPLRQNDFGGTIGGPIRKDKTFFFFSYEQLRLLLPQTDSGVFFTASARAAIAPVFQPIVNALPLPTGPLIDPTCDNITNPCLASLNAAYSNPSNFSATSIRIDHSLTSNITLFARYNHAPSYDAGRFWEELEYNNVNTDTLTAGVTIALAPTKTNDFRANWSRTTGTTITTLTNFDGAVVPRSSILFPPGSPYSFGTSQASVDFNASGNVMDVTDGTLYANVQRQLNFVDTFAWAVGVHQLKFGIDYRRLSPTSPGGADYVAGQGPSGFQTIVLGNVGVILLAVKDPFSVNINNYSLFAQDTWKLTNRLTLTYGLRWEINSPPESAISSKPLYTVQGIFDANPLAIVPRSLWHTRYDNFAPRIGAAYQVSPKTVVRGGFGFFYDLGYGNSGDVSASFPYFRMSFSLLPAPGVPFDLANPVFQPIPFSTTINPNMPGFLVAVDPNLQLPLTMEWNAAIERQLGTTQTLTVTYLGLDGRRLLREDTILPPSLLGQSVSAIWNGGYSHYEALQVQFQRRMSRGLQALVSYNLAKNSDLGSNDGTGFQAPSISQVVLPPLSPSDLDIRNSVSGAVSYELPAPAWGRVANAILKGWAVDGLVRASSAPPIDVTAGNATSFITFHQTQANVVPGQPYWIADPTQPSGKALNPAAFSLPAAGEMGDFPRNSLRSPYSIDQTDLALRRRFNLTERFKLDLRAEYFNVFNHPMFGAAGATEPNSQFGHPSFGKLDFGSTTNLVLGGGENGSQNALYAVGGPRSAQFSIKLLF
jgi:outer membrane receptor protein involved in Fe transport